MKSSSAHSAILRALHPRYTRATLALLLIALSLSPLQTYAATVQVTAIIREADVLPATSATAPTIPPPSTTVATTAAEFFSSTIASKATIAVGGAGVGSKLEMPAGLVITAAKWTGKVDVSYTTTVPPAVTGITSAKVVSVDFGGMEGVPVKLSSAAVVAIPYANFGSIPNPMVKIVDMAGETFTLGTCSATQYISPGALDKPASYFLPSFTTGGAQNCYMYDAANVYVASNHFSTFVAGVAAPVVAPAPPAPAPVVVSGGGGGGGGSGSSVIFSSSSPVALPPPPAQLPQITSPVTPSTPSKTQPSVSRPVCRFKFVPAKKIYSDVPINAWYSAAVTRLAGLGVLKKSTSPFQPDAPLRRYEALIFAMDGFGIKPARVLTKDPFKDVRKKDSFAPYVKAGMDSGIIVSKAPLFSPNAIVNRAEAVAMLLRAAKISVTMYVNRTASYYRDVPLDAWYFPYITKASDLCIIVGYNDNTLRPSKNVTRSEFVVMLDRVMQGVGR